MMRWGNPSLTFPNFLIFLVRQFAEILNLSTVARKAQEARRIAPAREISKNRQLGASKRRNIAIAP